MSFHPALRLNPLPQRAAAGVRAQIPGLRQVDRQQEPVYVTPLHATHDPGGGAVF